MIDCNYLSLDLDLLVLCEGVRFGNEIVTHGSGTNDIVRGSWPAELTHHSYTERDEWIKHVRKEATMCYHAAGTCRIGGGGDEMAVLDAKLKVRGVERLRVAGVSVIPSLHRAYTQMPAYGIGERLAELISQAWAKG